MLSRNYRIHPLRLNANPQGWRDFIARKYDDVFLALAQQVWTRDQWQCQYCGVLMKAGQEIINLDGCYAHNTLDNLITGCQFCVQCEFLESIGPEVYGGGTLIYLPEIEQEYLNGICYGLFRAIQEASEDEAVAEQTYRSLSLRAQLVEKHLGDGMSDPAVFGQLLIESGLSIEPNTFMAHLRLLPLRAAFKSQIAHDVDYTPMQDAD